MKPSPRFKYNSSGTPDGRGLGTMRGKLLFKPKKVYTLQDVENPSLFREQFPYHEIPRIMFDRDSVELEPADEIWITDTTFRDGQQSRPPYTTQQIVDLYELLHRLGGPAGVIRQSEFFLYSARDREAVEKCLSLGYRYPEVTGWIRASKDELNLVRSLGIRETGILTSVSDYHIFMKLGLTRRQAMDQYVSVVEKALGMNIRVRCHFEDVTRADVYGFCVPFACELMRLYHESAVPVKIRMCDTMGFGVPFPNAVLPRSVPRIIHALRHDADVPPHCLEWHGHNDFHKVIINATTAWLYGCSAVNASMLGIGERTGNPPLEAAVLDYIALKGHDDGIDTKVVTEIARYFERNIKYRIPHNQPFVGAEFNVTSAGIHADGLMKDEEVYNIFDTSSILNRPPSVSITDKSGSAGIAQWMNDHLGLEPRSRIDKRHSGVQKIVRWVNEQYRAGRTTAISHEEMLELAHKYLPEYFEVDLALLREVAHDAMAEFIEKLSRHPNMVSMKRELQEPMLQQAFKDNPFVQLALVANGKGEKNTDIFLRTGRITKEQEKRLDKNYTKRAWFIVPFENGTIHVTNLFKSKITGLLGLTVAAPVRKNDRIIGVLRLDCKFEDLIDFAREKQTRT
ncbi:MAG: histone-lysine N-methyltransferase [bacterium]